MEIHAERAHDDAVLHLTFAAKGNVLTAALMERLEAVLAEHQAEPHLKLVTLAGEGRHFSFGASVEEHRPDQAATMLARFHALIRRLGAYPIATAALVQGKCLGGAFELALACNFVLAANAAVFACPEVRLGVFPPALAVLGPSRLGAPLTERLLLGGGELTAAEALACGFVTEVAALDRELRTLADELFRRWLAPSSAFALRQGLAAIRDASGWAERLGPGLAAAERRYLEHVVPSHDGREGIEAFLAKRAPTWRDA